jgi:CubicO group peptidase (beta-lactamase class C family)
MRKAFSLLSYSLILVLLLASLACQSSGHPGIDSSNEKVDKVFAEWDKPDSPGAALAVIKDNAVIYKRGYGSAQLEYEIPITHSTVFHVASVSKQFTAFAITMLADLGKLSLDDDIRKHLPEVPDFGKKITIKHLLHHTSGLRDQWELLAVGGWRLDDVITKEHIMKMVRSQKELNFNPGSEHLYCNTGYTLLAEIVERVSGLPFPQWTNENMFKPLSMTNTHFHDDHEMIVKNRAYSYSPKDDEGFKKSVLSYANVGATSLFTTVVDLTKWAQNFWDPLVGGVAVIEQMQEQGVLTNGNKIDYAFGINIGKYKGLKTIAHSGGDAGFRSHVRIFPEQRFAVTVLSNLGSCNPSSLCEKVADIYLADQISQEAEEKKEERKIVKVDPAIYEAYEGKYKLPIGLVTLTRQGDRLMGKAGGETKFELFPESETKFFLKIVDAQIVFQKNEQGQVNTFTLFQGGEEMVGEKIKPPSLTAEELAEYEGSYYSEEVGTTYSIVVKDGKLIAKHRRHEDMPLSASDADQFVGEKWFFTNVQFIRDEENTVKGLKLSGGRVKNLRFDKK